MIEGYTDWGPIYTYEAENYMLLGTSPEPTTHGHRPLAVIDVAMSGRAHSRRHIRAIYNALGSTIGHTPYFRYSAFGFSAIYPRSTPLVDKIVEVSGVEGSASISTRVKSLSSHSGTVSFVAGSRGPYKWRKKKPTPAPMLSQSGYDNFISTVSDLWFNQYTDTVAIMSHYAKDLVANGEPDDNKISRIKTLLLSAGCTPAEVITFFAAHLPVKSTAAQAICEGGDK